MPCRGVRHAANQLGILLKHSTHLQQGIVWIHQVLESFENNDKVEMVTRKRKWLATSIQAESRNSLCTTFLYAGPRGVDAVNFIGVLEQGE